jgi:uncharacterized membrane protein
MVQGRAGTQTKSRNEGSTSTGNAKEVQTGHTGFEPRPGQQRWSEGGKKRGTREATLRGSRCERRAVHPVLAERRTLMAPLFILVIAFLVLRVIGLLGVSRLSSWREAGLLAVAIMFLFTGVTHFTDMKHDYAAMLPGFAPMKVSIIYLTGALQILGAVGLLIPRTRRLAGICLALLLVAMFPGNVYAALNDIEFRGDAPTPLWLRTPIQLFFIGMVLWTSIGKRSSEVGQSPAERPVAEHEQATRQGASS